MKGVARIVHRLRSWARWRSIDRLARGRFDWLRAPPSFANERVCLLATHSRDGMLSEHTHHLARAWAAHGYRVVLIIALDDGPAFAMSPHDHPYLAGVAVRENIGYDFGSWAQALATRPDHRDATMIVTTNDSVYGPLDGFTATLARVNDSAADVVALTDSYELRHHVQSYALFYKRAALTNPVFRRFWSAIGAFDRAHAITEAELPQLALLREAGLTVETLFPAPTEPVRNPTLCSWRELVEAGFPFVKAELMRTNPHGADLRGWQHLLTARGYDPDLVRRHLGPAFDGSAAAKATS